MADAIEQRRFNKQMIKPIRIKLDHNAKMVLDVQIPSYLVEAELIQSHDLPPLKDTIDSLQQCDETFYGYFDDNTMQLLGAISYKIEDAVLDIHRLIVHPDSFRRGIANALLTYIQTLATDCTKIIVSTGAANVPAKELYLKHNFHAIGVIEVLPNLFITSFEKMIVH
jgi:ribosomal protein S18 acetylase RimI-like enzyme